MKISFQIESFTLTFFYIDIKMKVYTCAKFILKNTDFRQRSEVR